MKEKLVGYVVLVVMAGFLAGMIWFNSKMVALNRELEPVFSDIREEHIELTVSVAKLNGLVNEVEEGIEWYWRERDLLVMVNNLIMP